MHDFTNARNENTEDEVWLVEHFPVFTQGKSGKLEHLLIQGSIPLIESNRGGKITYHGPGQQMMYVLLNLKRRKLSVKELVVLLEQTIINTLEKYKIYAYSRTDAPGVYIKERKICSLGLKIQKGCSLYGLALNVKMDLSPFLRINPCGYVDIKMTQVSEWDNTLTLEAIRPELVKNFLILLQNPQYEYNYTI